MLLLILGCVAQPKDTGATADDTHLGGLTSADTEDSSAGDTAPPKGDSGGTTEPEPDLLPEGFVYGDPIAFSASEMPDPTDTISFELVDAAMLKGGLGLMVGQGGYAIVDAVDATARTVYRYERGFRVALDDQTDIAWTSIRNKGVYGLDVSHPDYPRQGTPVVLTEGYLEDIAADGGRVLVGALDEGAILLKASGLSELSELSRLPADNAFAVALLGDRALVSDDEELLLFDVSDPYSPTELHRVSLGGEGRDIAFDGRTVAVAMGGDGVAVLALEGDALVERAELEMPGSVFSIDLDGDYLWAAAFDEAVLAWVGEGDPVVLGHEPAQQLALGVAARDGRAVVADWQVTTALAVNPGQAGPELDIPDTVHFSDDGGSTPITVNNAGPMPLHMRFTQPPAGYTVDPLELTVGPGDSEAIMVEAVPGAEEQPLAWTSDDPDEASGQTVLSSAVSAVGEVHQPMALSGFTYPDPSLGVYDLADQRGRVVLLVYFAST